MMSLLFDWLYLPALRHEASQCLDPASQYALEAIAFITAKVARGGRDAPPGSRPEPPWLSRMGGLMASKAKMVRSACEALVLSWSAQPPAEAKASLLETPGWSSPLASEAATQELALSLRDHRDRIGCAIEQQLANRPPGAPSWTPMETALKALHDAATST